MRDLQEGLANHKMQIKKKIDWCFKRPSFEVVNYIAIENWQVLSKYGLIIIFKVMREEIKYNNTTHIHMNVKSNWDI